MSDNSIQANTNEQQQQNNKYPKSIAFIISNEFCERFNYYGMRTILVLYLTIKLGYNDDTATVLFHLFTTMVYFFPILGAILADSLLGKFKTIVYLSCVYAVGSVLIALGAVPVLNLPAKAMTVIGLLLIGLGSGGIKPCVAAFGGDQFKIPEQAAQLATFFSFFYFSINAGSLISTSLTPILREDVHCFGDLDCFSLAFGVPGVLMVVSIIVFIFGRVLYTVKKPTGNVIVLVSKCVLNAISEKSKQSQRSLSHWLDYAEPKYGKQLVDDIKSILKILLLFVPLPLFWALFDQQGSRWTFQATRMTGDLGFMTLKPDQMQVINPLLILVFIPLFDICVYPLLSKIGVRRPLQKLTIGGILAGLAFLVSGFVEMELQKTYPVFPQAGEAQIRIYNGVPCTYEMNSTLMNGKGSISSLELWKETVPLTHNESFSFVLSSKDSLCMPLSGEFKLQPGHANSFFISGEQSTPKFQAFEEELEKTKSGYPNIRVLANVDGVKNIRFIDQKEGSIKSVDVNSNSLNEVFPSSYDIFADDIKIGSTHFSLGGVYAVSVNEDKSRNFHIKEHIITQPNSIHMLWLIPQFVIMTAAEVMFSVTGLEFSYSQAPDSMKSVLQACWLLTVAIGNLIVVAVAEARFFESQAGEFFLFAGLMFIDMIIFGILAMRYKYVKTAEEAAKQTDDEMTVQDTKKTFTNDAFQEE
ncbi:unnamed protein product [Diamesa tonsa]